MNNILHYSVDSDQYKQLNEESLPKICTYAVNEKGKDILYEYLQQIYKEVRPAKYHYSYANYPWNKIYTTNIDDIIECVYIKARQDIIIQNSRYCSTEPKKKEIEVFKLHWCVNNLSEGLIFDEEEYINSLLDIQDYRFGSFAIEIQNKDFVFIGSNYDDFNIKYYLNLYASTTFTSARGKLFFVNPYPSLMFESEIKKVKGILLKYTAEEFANILNEIIISKESIDSVRLRNDGYIQLRSKKKELTTLSESKYNSNLFIGSHPKWEDIFFDWDIIIPEIVNDFNSICSDFELKNEKSMVYSIIGKGYSGKSVILKRLANYLLSQGYEVIAFEGKSFDQNRFVNYVKNLAYNKYALVIDDGSYLYSQMEYIQKRLDDDKRIIILTTSRPYYHYKRKYSLVDYYYIEYNLDIKLNDYLSNNILDKIIEKGYLGMLSKLSTRSEQLDFIKSGKDLSSIIFEITNGKDFKTRFKRDISEIIRNGYCREILIKLAIVNKLELPYFPKELLVNISKNKAVGIIKRIDDIIRTDDSKTRINLKNYYISEFILREATPKEILNNLKELLIYLSPYVENTSSSYWNEMQSVLMRDKLIKQRLKLVQSDLKNMLYEIKDYYAKNYNYWLQLGIAEQLDRDYEKALNHFTQAESLGPNSYMVKNAIGKNYILQSVCEDNETISKSLFERGKMILLNLIDTKEEFQVKAYSIHSYILGLINFYTKNRTLVISKREISEAQLLLKRMLDKDKFDPLFNSINNKFNKFLLKIQSGNVTFNLQELQILNLNEREGDNLGDDLWE